MDDPVESETSRACALCQRSLSSENDGGDFEAISICGDCKFLFLEDSGTPVHDVPHRTPRVRETRYSNSSESIENLFSQHLSNMVNLARHNQPDNESQSVESVQRTSSRTTPRRSRGRRIILSDTESDGYDSVYGDSDVISYGAYAVDSDASVDAHSFLDNDALVHADAASVADSDTDIDPMHAGLNQWNSDSEEDEDDEDDDEADNNALESYVARVRLRRSLATNGRNQPANWLMEIGSPEVLIRMSERRQMHIPNLFGNSEEDEEQYVGNSGDYLDARGFEELLERLAETDSSRRGAPPAAVSFVNNLERLVVNEEEDGSGCAVCKELLCVGSVVNRLPCLHVYHPTCIMPWLSARNTCPICRYELPTDDKDYEKRKQMSSSRVHQVQNQDDDTSSEEEEAIMMGNEDGGGRRWFAIAAPIVGLVGIALVLWLGNPGGRGLFGATQAQAIRASASCPSSQRDNRSRRWWSLF